jgi:hypothetical protein
VTTLTTNAVGGRPTQGVLLGPLFFVGFDGSVDGGAVISDYLPGYPTKVLIQPVESFATPITVQGWRCANGSPMRFWYHGGSPFASVPVTPQALASTGDSALTLQPTAATSTSGLLLAYTGYMHFTATGTWKISVSQGGRQLGSAILRVKDDA